MLEAPMPKVSMLLVMFWIRRSAVATGATVVYQNLRKKYQMERSRRPRPTTVKPMTLPAENATRRPLFRLFWAALAVRQLAIVAVFMPMKPDRPLKKPPVIKANGVKKLKKPAAAMASSTQNTTAKKMPTPLYWRFK